MHPRSAPVNLARERRFCPWCELFSALRDRAAHRTTTSRGSFRKNRFFPRSDALSNLRLRAAYGMSGQRAFWLFSTGHRHGDLRRLIRQYGRAQDQVFRTGSNHRGATYGTDVAFPLHFQETQNANFTLDMCNVREA